MNEQVERNLSQLKRDILEALQRCTIGMMGACDDLEESVRAMDKIVDILSEQQQQAVYALVGSLLEMQNDEGESVVPHREVRRYVHEAADAFRTDLLRNISFNLARNGHPDVLDPNAELREEALRTLQ